MRAPVADLRPRPHPVAVALVAGLIGVAHRLAAQVHLQLLHRLGQRLRNMAVRHRDGADAELKPHDLPEQALDLALREVKLARQRAHQRQRARPELAAGHTRWQRRVVLVAAAAADAAQAQILRDMRRDRRQIEDLMANGFVLIAAHNHIALALRAPWLGLAHDLLVDMIAWQHRSETALVPRLGPDLAPALGLGGARATPGTVA